MDESGDIEECARKVAESLCTLYSLWLVGKLWRKRLGIHPGSGCESFLYGIKNVHAKP
jgi:hypothetical protein